MFGFFKPVEFDSNGNIVKEGAKKAPKKVSKKTENKRSTKEGKEVKMLLEYITDIKYELSGVEKLLTNREKKSMITALKSN